MYASTDFATKREFRRAVQQGLPVILYSPTLGTPAINGKATVTGPWPTTPTRKYEPLIGPKERRNSRGATTWIAQAEVRDMRAVAVY